MKTNVNYFATPARRNSQKIEFVTLLNAFSRSPGGEDNKIQLLIAIVMDFSGHS